MTILTGGLKDSLNTDNHLTPVRWVLALLVMVGHAWLVGTGSDTVHIHQWLISYIAVNGFFILSGLLIAKSLVTGRSKLRFISSRLIRIIPGLAFVLLVYAFLIGPAFTHDTDRELNLQDFVQYAIRVLLMQDPEATPGAIFADNPRTVFNGALWTIRFELIAYAIGAVLIWTGIVRSAATAIGVCAGFTLSYMLAPIFIEGGGLLSLLRLISAFTLGMVLWYVPALRRPTLLHVGILCAAFLAFGWSGAGELLLNGMLAALIMYAGLPRKANARLLKLPDWSYGIYLWHFPVMQLFLIVNPGLSPVSLLLHGLPVTLLMAMVSWKLIEKPALSLKTMRKRIPVAG